MRDRLAVSGDTLLSVGLRVALLFFYAATVYILVLALGGRADQTTPAPWWLNAAALLLIAATFLPMQRLLRRSVNQLVYGQHDNPYALLAQLNQHMDASLAPEAVLPALAATVAAALRLPFVSIETGASAGQPSAIYGAPPHHTEILSVPLAYRTTMLGTLQVSSRHPHERLSPEDLYLLADLARQVAITLHAAQLSTALQASREQLIAAREEERRRIRRDLHDGLGPALASLRLQLSALRHHVGANPTALALIDELRGDVRTATAEIRRLVYGLRPPMLDEFGLVGALRNLELADDQLLRTVEAPEPLPPLPAALEVALYRIAAEALHNIIRHARATACTISLAFTGDMLTLRVRDNGQGLPASYLPGVGHHAMQERATELGGSVSIEQAQGGGTCVTATFPLKGAADA